MKYVVLIIIIALAVLYFTRSANDKKAALENIAIGKDFLAKNKVAEGISETASGLQYQVLQQGEGDVHPTASSKVKVHYHGSLLDGTVFDSSVDSGKPFSFG
jgi:peptidylprolyl isomerase